MMGDGKRPRSSGAPGAKRQKIPKGYHMMPDGTIMKDSDHDLAEELDGSQSNPNDLRLDKRMSQAYLSPLPEQVSKNKCSGNGHR